MWGVNEILLIKHFLVDLLHMRFCICLVLFVLKSAFSGSGTARQVQNPVGWAAYNDRPFGKYSISEWPQVPQASLVSSTAHSLSCQRWNFNEEH